MSATQYSVRGAPRSRPALAIRRIPLEVWALGALVVIAAVIRIVTIDNQSFWMDEALTAYESHLPLGAMLNTVAHVETTPPLYFVLSWAWAHLFGISEPALRSISTIAGIALVPIAYLAGRDLVSRATGLIAAAFVTFDPFLIWYSQEARAYMLLAALCGASFLWFVRAREEPTRRNLGWWALFSALALMTHFFAGFLVGAEAVWLLWSARSRIALISVAAVGAVQLALLPLAVGDTGHFASWVSRVSRVHRISTTVLEWGVSLLQRRGTVAEAIPALLALVVITTALVVVGGDRRTRRGAAVAGAIAAFVFLAPLALALVGQDYFLSRNEIPAFVPLAVAVAAGCAAPRARLAGGAFALVLVAVFAGAAIYVQTHPYLQRPNWRHVAAALGPARAPRAILAADGTTADPLKIYLPGVDWTQSRRLRVPVAEIDVIGATKKIAVVPRNVAAAAPQGGHVPRARPLPRKVAPPGARLIARERVNNWVLARFALRRPRRLSINNLAALAPGFFTHTPQALLVFTQPGGMSGP